MRKDKGRTDAAEWKTRGRNSRGKILPDEREKETKRGKQEVRSIDCKKEDEK